MPCSLRAIVPAAIVCCVLSISAFAQTQDLGLGSQEDQKNLVAGICTTQLKDLDAAGCACLAERSLTELDDRQRAYLILSVVQPPAAERLPIAREQEQLAAIFTFLETSHAACAGPATPPAEEGAPLEQPAPQ